MADPAVRVTLLNQYYAPDEASTAQLLSDLGAGLARAGHQVRAVAARRSYADPSRIYPARERLDGVEVVRTRTTAFGRGRAAGRLLDYLSFLAGAVRVVAFDRRPDVVLSLSTPPLVALLGLGLARLRGARAIYWVMDLYPDLAFELGVLGARSLAGRAMQWLSRLTLRRSDAVVALGETMAARLRQRGATRVAVIHNWADGETIRPCAAEDSPLRREWGWGDRFVLLYSGNMGLAHEFETALGAAHALRDRDDLRFVFLGGGPRRGEVEQRARQLDLPNVEFRPYVARERLGASLTAADAHLVTLRQRMPGLLVPSKIYGILAAGRPTIYVGPREGEVAEILLQGDCGAAVEPGDVDGLARAVLDSAGDRARRLEQGRRARELFDARFARPLALAAFAELIGSVQAGAAPRSR